MPDSQVEEVKSKVDIVAVIGEHVQLTKSGSNFKGLCPFHQEKSPSFMVSEELQIYKCFGCGEAGDCFTFLEKYEGMEFPEALRFLADRVGVKLVTTNPALASEKDILYELNALAAKFYNFLLVSHGIGKVALNYLKEDRKITEESIKTFNIGFAPTNKNALSDFLIKKKKYKVKDLEKAGLIFVSKFGKVYDRFEGRIIFPISDHRGNVIALAGRLLPPGKKDVGKYINSPETLIYHKSSSLYGINITKDFIKKAGFAVVVEGEIDLISSFQIGIKNVVAIKGSAFTDGQARLLGRYTKDVVLALDTDFAGQQASIRGIKILDELEFEIRVAKLGIYKDPDDASKANPDFYKEKVNSSVNIWDFIIDSTVERFDKNSSAGKSKIAKFLTPILSEIDNEIVKDHYINKLAKALAVSEEAVSEEVEKQKSKNPDIAPAKAEIKPLDRPIREIREETLMGLILKEKPEILKNPEIQKLIQTPFAKKIIDEFINFKDYSLETFAKSLPRELFDRFSEIILAGDVDNKDVKKEINKIYKELSISLIRQNLSKEMESLEYGELQSKLKAFESDKFESIIS